MRYSGPGLRCARAYMFVCVQTHLVCVNVTMLNIDQKVMRARMRVYVNVQICDTSPRLMIHFGSSCMDMMQVMVVFMLLYLNICMHTCIHTCTRVHACIHTYVHIRTHKCSKNS